MSNNEKLLSNKKEEAFNKNSNLVESQRQQYKNPVSKAHILYIPRVWHSQKDKTIGMEKS